MEQYKIIKTNNEFWVRRISDNELVYVAETREEAKRFIKKREKTQKNSKPSSIFNKKAIREINKIAVSIINSK